MAPPIRVMVVEDDLNIAYLHQRYLQKMNNYEVIGIATSKAEAELQLDVLKPDLLLLDVYLPDGTGLELLQSLRSLNQSCDVILITADRDVETLQQAMRCGVVDYLLKPIIFSRLEAALQKYASQTQQLVNSSNIDQVLVDKMLQFSTLTDLTELRLPKGIDRVTLDKIRSLFSSNPILTADAAGEKIGASRTTARRYLEYLIGAGELAADLNYGSVGRPERSYYKP
ncbi:response regulator [Vibrio ostreicida]